MNYTKDRNPRSRGDYYERIARRHLEHNGLQFLEGNYYCRFGEIDLIMLDTPKSMVFVEVKFRGTAAFGHATEMVGIPKQRKMRQTALHYLQRNPSMQKLSCRFDVIGMTQHNKLKNAEIHWIKNAFS